MLLSFLVIVTSLAAADSTTVLPQSHLQQESKSAVPEEKVHLKEFHDLLLNCTCPPPSSAVRWSKDGSPLPETSKGSSENNDLNSNSDPKPKQQQPISYKINTTDPNLSQLVITKANSTDIGDYECRETSSNSHHQQLLHRFIVRAKPRVKFNLSSPVAGGTALRSQTVLLGNPWAVNCEFASALYSLNASIALLRCGPVEPVIKVGGASQSSSSSPIDLWCGRPSLAALQAETTAWMASSRGRVTIRRRSTPFTTSVSHLPEHQMGLSTKAEHKHLNNSTAVSLSVRSVRFEDVGYYLCAAENALALSEAVVRLRVEDRYQAIWPAVLLLGLALYLFSLVVVFESRRYLATNFLKLDIDTKVN